MTLIIKESSIPDGGRGVFTTEKIKKGDVIGEYYGIVVKENTNILPREEPYLYSTENNNVIIPSRTCIVSLINDIVDLRKSAIKNHHSLIKYLDYSTEFIENEDNSKVFVVATRDIEENEELFVRYGKSYWKPRIKRMKSTILAEKVMEHGDIDHFFTMCKRKGHKTNYYDNK